VAIWICFLIRAFFHCAALPLWEGFDEWSHSGVVQRMALRGELMVSRESPLPRNTAASLDLASLPWEMRSLPPPSVTHDAFWRLDSAERARREALLRAVPPAWALEDSTVLKVHEGLHGPLYGWLMAPVAPHGAECRRFPERAPRGRTGGPSRGITVRGGAGCIHVHRPFVPLAVARRRTRQSVHVADCAERERSTLRERRTGGDAEGQADGARNVAGLRVYRCPGCGARNPFAGDPPENA
jgi:hypothetical protein